MSLGSANQAPRLPRQPHHLQMATVVWPIVTCVFVRTESALSTTKYVCVCVCVCVYVLRGGGASTVSSGLQTRSPQQLQLRPT
jgi:hypothetical protein